MSYIITWKREDGKTITGARRYATKAEAERQIRRWQPLFAANVYAVELVRD